MQGIRKVTHPNDVYWHGPCKPLGRKKIKISVPKLFLTTRTKNPFFGAAVWAVLPAELCMQYPKGKKQSRACNISGLLQLSPCQPKEPPATQPRFHFQHDEHGRPQSISGVWQRISYPIRSCVDSTFSAQRSAQVVLVVSILPVRFPPC